MLFTQMRKQEELMKSMDVAIEDGYLKAPEIIALCQVRRSCRMAVLYPTLRCFHA